ncbi:unnamed protein product, partial [Tetraodon nigroviridis]
TMSLKHAVSRGLEWGRSVFQLGLIKSGGRVVAKFRADRFRVGPQARGLQPRAFLPARYRYYRTSLRGLAAQLQSAAFRRGFGASQIPQAVFKKKRLQAPLRPFTSGYRLEDYVIGNQIGKGSNAAVYEAAASLAPLAPLKDEACVVELKEDGEQPVRPLTCCSLRNFPLAIKMMWNFGVWQGRPSEAILRSMSQELVPVGRAALNRRDQVVLDGHFGVSPKGLAAHPNIVRVCRVFTAEVPLLPGALEEYPDMLPARLNPAGLGNNRTLFLVMKNYPYTLQRFLAESAPSRRQRALMLLQLLEGVDHLCRHGVAHRDLKSDNVLLELDAAGDPRVVISDFGCCLSQRDRSLQLPFSSVCVSRGGNVSLMAPEVINALPGTNMVIDYSKADAWAVGAIAYEIFGRPNPFYRGVGLESRRYQEKQLPPLPSWVPGDVQSLIRLLLRRNPEKVLKPPLSTFT